jgi:hypothetical protein
MARKKKPKFKSETYMCNKTLKMEERDGVEEESFTKGKLYHSTEDRFYGGRLCLVDNTKEEHYVCQEPEREEIDPWDIHFTKIED